MKSVKSNLLVGWIVVIGLSYLLWSNLEWFAEGEVVLHFIIGWITSVFILVLFWWCCYWTSVIIDSGKRKK